MTKEELLKKVEELKKINRVLEIEILESKKEQLSKNLDFAKILLELELTKEHSESEIELIQQKSSKLNSISANYNLDLLSKLELENLIEEVDNITIEYKSLEIE